jgi:hypothetical protein
MTIKRLLLGLLTIFALFVITHSLLDSWNQPQIQGRLELYQTNLLLQASEWQGDKAGDANLTNARNALLGESPLKTAQKQYEEARSEDRTTLEKLQARLEKLKSEADANPDTAKSEQPLQASIKKVKQLIAELDLRLGILQARQGQTETAIKTWTELINRSKQQASSELQIKPAAVLLGLWSNPPSLMVDAQPQIQQHLDGWFRDRALTKLYQVQERQEELAALRAREQERAEAAAVKLAIVGAIPLVGVLVGVGLLIFLLAGVLIKGKEAILAQNADLPWTTPWNAEIIWQVFVVGFFFIGQFLLPLFFSLLPLNRASFDTRTQAVFVLASYAMLAFACLLVLYLSIRSFLPLPEGWFRFNWRGNWILWGLGGYLVALPLVIVVSLINQKLWQGQGGSNPLLPIALEGRDSVALAIFFLTAAVAAPLFEEFLFRGFLLPSLTRYMPVWGAITLSSLFFAIVHLNLSEILPLATLGMVLGVVYTRSRNLLAPMLLHSLWNGGTLLSLFLLGSGSA